MLTSAKSREPWYKKVYFSETTYVCVLKQQISSFQHSLNKFQTGSNFTNTSPPPHPPRPPPPFPPPPSHTHTNTPPNGPLKSPPRLEVNYFTHILEKFETFSMKKLEINLRSFFKKKSIVFSRNYCFFMYQHYMQIHERNTNFVLFAFIITYQSLIINKSTSKLF